MRFKIAKNLWQVSGVFVLIIALFAQQVAAVTPDSVYCAQLGGIVCNYEPSLCTPSPTTTTTDPSITINNTAAQQVAQQASTGGTNVGYALYDSTGKLLANYNDTFENYGASITKSMVLVAYLNQVGSGIISAADQATVTGMIEQSSDSDANSVIGLLNNPTQQINAVAQSAGMTGFKPNLTGDSLYNLGQSQITANDFAKFFSKIDTMFPAAQKSFALKLLSTITPQAGLLQANLPGTVYSKEGWKPEPGGGSDPAVSGSPNPFGNEGSPWVVNQAGQFTSGGTTYGVAVTVGGTDSESSGETIIKNVVSALISPGSASTPTPSSGSSSCSCSSGGSTILTGSDPEAQVWNYFTGQAGLSDAQAAGIMGNLDQESSFVSDRVQGNANESQTNDPSTIVPSNYGYGIAQWDADAIVGYAKDNSVSGPIYALSTQLNLIMAQLKATTPYGGMTDPLKIIETMTDAGQVATFFDNNFEGGTDPGGTGPGPTGAGPGGIREQDAASILSKYGGTGTTTTTSTGSCGSTGTSTNCTTATGDAKILCEAEQFTGVYYLYGGGHPPYDSNYQDFVSKCPDLSNPPDNQPSGKVGADGFSGNPSPCAVDCSALVSYSVDAAFNLNYLWSVAGSMQGTGAGGWKSIPWSQAQPGDIVTAPDHVEVFDYIKGGALYTVGAHSTGQKDGVISWPNDGLSEFTGGVWEWDPGSSS